MQKCRTLRNTPKAKTSSMFYKNKKTIRKIETPLCSNNAKDDNNIQDYKSKGTLWDIINSNDNLEDIIRIRERKMSYQVFNNIPLDSNFDINNYYSNNYNYYQDNTEAFSPYNDDKMKILSLNKEKMYLNNNNIKLLQLLNENNQKNAELKSYIEEYTKKGLLAKAKFLRHLEKLKHRSKEINFDLSLFEKKKVNYQNIEEIKKENEFLLKKIKIKNNDFQNLYDFMMEIISYSEPYIKQCQDDLNDLYSFQNNKLKENSFENSISGEIVHVKNDYEKLKIKYNELLEKMKNENEKEEHQKQKVKFVVKNISEKSIKEYETKINKLKEDNNKLINDYKPQVEELKNELYDLNMKIINKDKEFESLNDKYQNIIKSLNEKLNIKGDINF